MTAIEPARTRFALLPCVSARFRTLRVTPFAFLAFLFLSAGSFAGALSQEQERPLFDPQANASAELREATEKAAQRYKRVLIVWGSQAVAGSRELVAALESCRPHTGWPLYYEYERVLVDVGEGTRRKGLAAGLGADFAAGLPLVSVLDGRGTALVHVPAARWRAEHGYDTEAIGRFLAAYCLPPRDAEQALARGLAEAKKTNRRLLIRLGAPW